MRGIFKNEKAFSLVESVIALAIVGVAMVIITQVSLATLKQAKKNELQEVAVQSAVEAMDFVKQPSDLLVDVDPPRSYKLDLTYVKLISSGLDQSDITTCDSSSDYLVNSLFSSGYTICQQVFITKPGPSEQKWDVRVLVLWKTVDGKIDKAEIKGYRLGGTVK
ncbi:MAG: type II secretion system protein [Candidatus Dojkabacteria bacterium]|nr:type II secretion system protein [Candidatus Dojkabacteria bacterium]